MYAYAWRDGLIAFGSSVPSGALPIAQTKKKRLVSVVEELAQRQKSGSGQEQLHVPGVNEATDSEAALDLLFAFRHQVELRLQVPKEAA
jgi:hypothetical protein